VLWRGGWPVFTLTGKQGFSITSSFFSLHVQRRARTKRQGKGARVLLLRINFVKTKSPLKSSWTYWDILDFANCKLCICILQAAEIPIQIRFNRQILWSEENSLEIYWPLLQLLHWPWKHSLAIALAQQKHPGTVVSIGLSAATCAIAEMESIMNLRQQPHSKETREIWLWRENLKASGGLKVMQGNCCDKTFKVAASGWFHPSKV
jgi:hypothetical protein